MLSVTSVFGWSQAARQQGKNCQTAFAEAQQIHAEGRVRRSANR